MSSDEQERRRIARLREQQLNARNPGDSKIPGYDWSKAAAQGRMRKKKNQKSFFGELFGVLPKRYRWMLTSLVLSAIPTVAILALVPEEFQALALLPPLIFGVAGLLLGTVLTDRAD